MCGNEIQKHILNPLERLLHSYLQLNSNVLEQLHFYSWMMEFVTNCHLVLGGNVVTRKEKNKHSNSSSNFERRCRRCFP